MWSYSQGSSGSEYNGPSLLFMFQLWPRFQLWPQGFYCISKQNIQIFNEIRWKKICFLNIDSLLHYEKDIICLVSEIQRVCLCSEWFILWWLDVVSVFSLYCFMVVLGLVNPSLVRLIDRTRTEIRLPSDPVLSPHMTLLKIITICITVFNMVSSLSLRYSGSFQSVSVKKDIEMSVK